MGTRILREVTLKYELSLHTGQWNIMMRPILLGDHQ